MAKDKTIKGWAVVSKDSGEIMRTDHGELYVYIKKSAMFKILVGARNLKSVPVEITIKSK